MTSGGVGCEGRCRVCVGAPEDGQDLFDEDAHCLREAIAALFSFHVRPTDDSTVVCSRCSRIIREFYVYYLEVKSAQIYFKNVEEYDSAKVEPDYKEIIQIDDYSNYSHIKTELCSVVYEDKLHDKSDEILLLENEGDGRREMKINADDFDSFKNSLNLDYNNRNNSMFGSDQVFTENLSQDKPLKKCKLKKQCKLPKNEEYLKNKVNNSPLRNHRSSNNNYEFPTELFKNGKLIIKGSILEDLISKFYDIECDMCPDHPSFKNVEMMLTHYNSEHNARGYLICCNTHLYHHRAIYMHMARHLQPSAFECPICKKALSRPHSLKSHLQTHLPEAEKPHKCNKCDKRFRVIEGLKNHIITHIPLEDRKKYDCKICGKIFTLPTSFTTHMNSGHSTVKYLCSECGRSFKKQTELTHHMLTHDTSGKNEKQCQLCGFMCKNLPTYKIHIKLHLGERLQCTLCDYNTHRRCQLNRHMRTRHSDEKPHTCVVCQKQFKLKSTLKLHLLLHTGERKYACNFCTRTFASSSNYHTHRKKDHPEEHRNEAIMRHSKKFREIPNSENSEPVQNDSIIHEMARECLQKIAEQSCKKKNEEK